MSEEKKWYVTIGYLGGEYAVKAVTLEAASEIIAPAPPVLENQPIPQIPGGYTFASVTRTASAGVTFRPAPPELAEWLDAPNEFKLISGSVMTYRLKVSGGWLYDQDVSGHCAFVPVALASGITVLENNDE